MKLDEKIENLLYNYKYMLGKLLQLRDAMRGEFETQLGISDAPQYPTEYANMMREYEETEAVLIKIEKMILEQTQVSSIDLANNYAIFLSQTNSEKYKVFNKKIGDLTYLYVSKKEGSTTPSSDGIIDIGTVITKKTTRGLFDKFKTIDGQQYEIRSFLPEEYVGIFEPESEKQSSSKGPSFE